MMKSPILHYSDRIGDWCTDDEDNELFICDDAVQAIRPTPIDAKIRLVIGRGVRVTIDKYGVDEFDIRIDGNTYPDTYLYKALQDAIEFPFDALVDVEVVEW